MKASEYENSILQFVEASVLRFLPNKIAAFTMGAIEICVDGDDDDCNNKKLLLYGYGATLAFQIDICGIFGFLMKIHQSFKILDLLFK